MRRISFPLHLLVLLQPTLICHAHQNPAPHRTITGTVSNSVSGEPIRHALVQLSGVLPASALTGPDGRFRFDDVPEGQINLSAQRPGFFDSRFMPGNEWRPSAPPSTFSSGSNDFPLTLMPAARIVGRITDRDGEPVENAQVQVLSEQIMQGRKHWQNQNVSNTDDDGAYRIDDLVPGRYILFACGHGLPSSSWNAPGEVSAPKYYPDAPDLASAQPVEVRPGQEFRADFNLPAERGFRVTANVGGVPAALVNGFSLENSSGQIVGFDGINFDQSRGQLVAQAVPSGRWTLAISANDGQGHSYETRQEINVNNADVSDLQLVLHPGASIPVMVNHAASVAQPPSEQAGVNPGLNVMLVSAELLNARGYGTQSQGAPPTLMFSEVTPGKYKLDVQTYGSECVESASYGNLDLLRDYLVVGSDGQTQPLTINLRSDCAVLSVKIRPGDHQGGSGFLLVVPSSPLAEPKILPIGTQPFLTLSPGSYQVFAFSSLEGVEYANPEALRDYPSQSITLEPGQKSEVAVELIEHKPN